MKGIKRGFTLLLTVFLIVTSLSSIGWAGDNTFGKNDPVAQGWYMMDLLFARPMGIVAGVFGSAVFVVSLPFTIPTGGVRDAADMFIVKPFQFSFVRQFPDEDI